MEFLISDTFTDSLARLTGDEQKLVKTTAFDLQMDPVNPGMQLHRLDRAKDPNFWSARVGRDLRLILHKTASRMILCFAGHHDAAYAWAERRKIERHPRTGAAQIVEIREVVREIEVHSFVERPAAARAAPLLFRTQTDDELLGCGVPAEWLADVRRATEDSIFELCDHLPPEAAEALMDLATGTSPRTAAPEVAMTAAASGPRTIRVASPSAARPRADDGFKHPDAQRRFRVMANADELGRALDAPWEKWTVFLHPAQRDLVEKRYNGPVRVSGSAGTGKTVVALHRAVHLARAQTHGRTLLTTFSPLLARFLRRKLEHLISGDAALVERIEVATVSEVGERVYAAVAGQPRIADGVAITRIVRAAAAAVSGHGMTERFLVEEWNEVVDAWQIDSWERYRDVPRLGRKTRLNEKQRRVAWSVLERVREGLEREGLVTPPSMLVRAAQMVAAGGTSPYAAAVVDEAQDVSVSQLRLLAALVGKRPDGLFFTGDLGQRIFQTPFSWKSLGVDIRGRSYTLRVNYRTSHQIRRQADRLLPGEISDVDGNAEQRRGTISVFNGPEPTVEVLASVEQEAARIGEWIRGRVGAGFQPGEVGVFVRAPSQLPRARQAVQLAGLLAIELDDGDEPTLNRVSLCTMHLAKGLEFRAVVVAALDEDVVPLAQRLEAAADNADLEEIYNSERHLLYVACTRARDCLLLTGVRPGSEFLGDLLE